MPENPLSDQPPFSIVAAVYNVSQYLDEFFTSLERQSYGLENLDVVLVDDGSTDHSRAMCESFAAKWPTAVRVLHKENGGQATARNLGLEVVRGDWVSFVDPDDMLDERYFDAVAAFLELNSAVELRMLSTPFIFYYEENGRKAATHPLHFKFAQGDRVVDLRVEPENIQLGSNTAFFRTDLIRTSGLRFDDRVRPTFEDAHFVARYLVAADEPLVGLIGSARYYYRKRADKSSAVDTGYAQPGKYIDVPKYGYIGALEHAQRTLGQVPLWLQYTVLYDLTWTFRTDSAVTSATGSLSPEIREQFHELVRETLSYISSEALASFSIIAMPDDIRFAFTYGYEAPVDLPANVRFSRFDRARGLANIQYRFAGELPRETIYVDSTVVEPVHQKIRSIEFFGRALAYERILWVPIGKQIRMFIDGVPMSIGPEVNRRNFRIGEQDGVHRQRTEWNARPELFRDPNEALLPRAEKLLRREIGRRALRTKSLALLLHSGAARRAFKDAWVFMDRNTDAGDSAEILYKYVAEKHPEINAWFVINRDTPDWKRLRREGVRVVAYGSLRWKLLMLSAAHLASSHADQYVLRPLDTKRFGEPRWRFTFLQHGVIKDDLSRWLNPKKIDLFVTASPAEYESIVADNTPYAFSSKEVVLTGLPRHDALIAKREATPLPSRNYLLVMPTWRHNLVGVATTSSTKRTRNHEFAESNYAAHYSQLLQSEKLATIAKERDCEIVFMPHPMMGPYLAEFNVPANVRVLGYDDADVQQILARAAILITDYSSMAFNTAMLNIPTIYYQFDRAEFYSGSHPSRAGYYDYDLHGFGPVCETLQLVEEAAGDLLSPNSSTRSDYSDRMERAFAFHDTNNSARVVEAMKRLTSPDAGLTRIKPRATVPSEQSATGETAEASLV